MSANYDIVIFAPTSHGGLAEHINYQANALHNAGASVILLTVPGFLGGRATVYQTAEIFALLGQGSGLCAKAYRLKTFINYYKTLERWLKQHHCKILFLESYREYFSPFWAKYFARIRSSGIVVGTNLHDPVRDNRVGPRWWHDWSVRLAYRDLSFVLCHQELPKSANVPSHVSIYVVPVGIYQPPPAVVDREKSRNELGLPLDKQIFLSFGFIRDNKNLDMFIRVMSRVESAYLLVAGRTQSDKDRTVDKYLVIAAESGVGARVRFDFEFIPERKIPLYFTAADIVLLTYNASFHSQSGVLNIAASYRKPVLASSGASPLRDAVIKFHLGCFIEADNEEALCSAMKNGVDESLADWDAYLQYASWDTNIAPIFELLNHLKNQDDEKV